MGANRGLGGVSGQFNGAHSNFVTDEQYLNSLANGRIRDTARLINILNRVRIPDNLINFFRNNRQLVLRSLFSNFLAARNNPRARELNLTALRNFLRTIPYHDRIRLISLALRALPENFINSRGNNQQRASLFGHIQRAASISSKDQREQLARDLMYQLYGSNSGGVSFDGNGYIISHVLPQQNGASVDAVAGNSGVQSSAEPDPDNPFANHPSLSATEDSVRAEEEAQQRVFAQIQNDPMRFNQDLRRIIQNQQQRSDIESIPDLNEFENKIKTLIRAREGEGNE